VLIVPGGAATPAFGAIKPVGLRLISAPEVAVVAGSDVVVLVVGVDVVVPAGVVVLFTPRFGNWAGLTVGGVIVPGGAATPALGAIKPVGLRLMSAPELAVVVSEVVVLVVDVGGDVVVPPDVVVLSTPKRGSWLGLTSGGVMVPGGAATPALGAIKPLSVRVIAAPLVDSAAAVVFAVPVVGVLVVARSPAVKVDAAGRVEVEGTAPFCSDCRSSSAALARLVVLLAERSGSWLLSGLSGFCVPPTPFCVLLPFCSVAPVPTCGCASLSMISAETLKIR
jgi:hypothetical protein